eukprot:1134546-Pyramimonas_sp.AAC.1
MAYPAPLPGLEQPAQYVAVFKYGAYSHPEQYKTPSKASSRSAGGAGGRAGGVDADSPAVPS